jgi:uncharacterized protein (TIGR00251 family)
VTAPHIETDKKGVAVLSVRVQPRAKREGIVGLQGDDVKIALHAPPVDGAANEALIAYLSKLCGVPKSNVTIQSGQQGRNKRLAIEGLSADELACIIERALP